MALTTHPAMMPRRMSCKKINSVTCSDHGTVLVEYERYVYTCSTTGELIGPPVAVKDCVSIFDIVNGGCDGNGITFGFKEYFTEKEQAELQSAFERDEYDYLGNLPEI